MEENQVALRPSTNADILQQNQELIKTLAQKDGVDVEKMHGLLDLQERILNKQAEINFNNALGDMQSEMPRIKKDGQVVVKGEVRSTYATYEQIDDVIRPLLQKYGFSLRFNSRESSGKVVVTGTLAHRDGHSITDEIPLTVDSSGSKNSVQGVGSTIAYGKRYLVGMLLNLVFEGEDDDGRMSGFIQISLEHAAEIDKLIVESGTDKNLFLKWANAKSVPEMDERKYESGIRMLKQKMVNKGVAE